MSSKQEGVLEQADRLFDDTDDDRARSVLASLKDAFEVATEKLAKARSKVIDAEREKERAQHILQDFIALEYNGHNHVTVEVVKSEPSEAPESAEPCPAGVDPTTGEIAPEAEPGEPEQAETPEPEAEPDPVPFDEPAEEPDAYEEGTDGDLDDIEAQMFAEAEAEQPTTQAPVLEHLPAKIHDRMVDKVLSGPKDEHAHEVHTSVHYTLKKTEDVDTTGDLRLTIGDAPDDDFAVTAALKFFEPLARGQVGMAANRREFKVNKAAYVRARSQELVGSEPTL